MFGAGTAALFSISWTLNFFSRKQVSSIFFFSSFSIKYIFLKPLNPFGGVLDFAPNHVSALQWVVVVMVMLVILMKGVVEVVTFQAFAVIGIPLIARGEDVGADMAMLTGRSESLNSPHFLESAMMGFLVTPGNVAPSNSLWGRDELQLTGGGTKRFIVPTLRRE
jgi:hypothetical protein